jgi:hypothetical protein
VVTSIAPLMNFCSESSAPKSQEPLALMKICGGAATADSQLELIADPTANTESIAGREGCSVRKVNMTISLASSRPISSRQQSTDDSPTEWEWPASATSGRVVSSAPDAWAIPAVTFRSNRAFPRPGVVLR